jgi:hypothetical protein
VRASLRALLIVALGSGSFAVARQVARDEPERPRPVSEMRVRSAPVDVDLPSVPTTVQAIPTPAATRTRAPQPVATAAPTVRPEPTVTIIEDAE